MTAKKILFISGSLGLGHVARDLAIAGELRKQNPGVEISWLAAPPASQVLTDANENLLPEANEYADENISAERASRGAQLNLIEYLLQAKNQWTMNVEIFKQVTAKEKFDLVIGDETYEIMVALSENPNLISCPFAMIYDFLGLDSRTINPIEKIGTYLWNRKWAQDQKIFSHGKNLALFVGVGEDIPDKSFGFLLPNRPEHAKKYYNFLGYILTFDPSEYANKKRIRKDLGYGDEPLIICSIGGTRIGKKLLELCGAAYPIIKGQIPNLRMVLVCGPRLPASSIKVPQGVEVKQYVPALYKHFAACDLAIVQGGGSTTIELAALKKPFLYFPIEGHCEQELHVAARLERYNAGIRMTYSKTTPDALAEKVISNIGAKVDYEEIPVHGAKQAARLISQILK